MEDMRRNLIDLTATLRRREAEAQALLQGVVEGVFAVDAERNVRYLNPQAARMLGVEPAAAVGRFCGDVLRPCGADGQRPCEIGLPDRRGARRRARRRRPRCSRRDGGARGRS